MFKPAQKTCSSVSLTAGRTKVAKHTQERIVYPLVLAKVGVTDDDDDAHADDINPP